MSTGRRLDQLQLMLMVHQHRSIKQMSLALDRAVSTIHEDLVELEHKGLINPPSVPRAARDRSLTLTGKEFLRKNGVKLD